MTAFRGLCSPRNAAENVVSLGQFFELEKITTIWSTVAPPYKNLGNPYLLIFFEPKFFEGTVVPSALAPNFASRPCFDPKRFYHNHWTTILDQALTWDTRFSFLSSICKLT